MKNTAAVFLTSLAVSAISLTVPLPAASTVLNLFIGEDIAVQDTASHHIKGYQQAPFESRGASRNCADSRHWQDAYQTTFSYTERHRNRGTDEKSVIQCLSNASANLRQCLQRGLLHFKTDIGNRVQPFIALHTPADEAEPGGYYYQKIITAGDGYLEVTRALK